jgi:hypothetical protein
MIVIFDQKYILTNLTLGIIQKFNDLTKNNVLGKKR